MTNSVSAVSRRDFLQLGTGAMLGVELSSRSGAASNRHRRDSPLARHGVPVKALVFDVFGTVVDWRATVTRDVEELAKRKGLAVDGAKFADRWRAGYGPSMNRVRTGELPWTKLDGLHRMILDQLLIEFGVQGLTAAETDALNRTWHRLRPWPDVVDGLTRLKRQFVIAPLSNGNLSLMIDLAKHSGLPWDCILGAELVRHYKPDPEVYQSAADLLDLRPDEVMMVAAHLGDLRAAKAVGLRTAFVARPLEYGADGRPDLKPDSSTDLSAKDFNDLAVRLGA